MFTRFPLHFAKCLSPYSAWKVTCNYQQVVGKNQDISRKTNTTGFNYNRGHYLNMLQPDSVRITNSETLR